MIYYITNYIIGADMPNALLDYGLYLISQRLIEFGKTLQEFNLPPYQLQ